MAKRKGGTSIEEIEAWARRMIDDVEDFDFIESAGKWRDFVDEKMGPVTDTPEAREGRVKQLAAIEDGRLALLDFETTLGFKQTTSKTGQVVLRDTSGQQRPGTFVSPKKIAVRIEEAKRERGDIPF